MGGPFDIVIVDPMAGAGDGLSPRLSSTNIMSQKFTDNFDTTVRGSTFLPISNDLFECLFYFPVNSNGHVGMLPPFYGTFTQH